MHKKSLILIIAIFIMAAPSCKFGNTHDPVVVDVSSKNNSNEPNIISKSPGNYDLKNPARKWQLPSDLVEVSGNAWIDNDHLLLIEDLHPFLYLVKIENDKASLEKKIPFAQQEKDKVDIEDVAVANGVTYALWSHGVIFKINNWKETPGITRIETGLNKKNNTEGLCFDPVTKKLLIACKDDAGIDEEKKSAKAVYSLDLGTGKLDPQPVLVIKPQDFEQIAGDKIKFNPSAIAVHPVTHDYYLLSTRDNKCMAVFGRDGTLKSFQMIDADLMQQPEGICFSPAGILYISSEGKKGDAGNLFEFNEVKEVKN